MWAGRREREIEGGREQAGWRTGGARGRTDVCVRASRRERGIEGGGRIGGGRRQENERAGGWRTASCRENFKQLVGRTLLRHLMVADSHDRQMREVKDAFLGH